MIAVEVAGGSLETPNLLVALPRLRTPESTNTFIELWNDCGSVLVERIVSAYRELRRWPPQSVLVNAGNSG